MIFPKLLPGYQQISHIGRTGRYRTLCPQATIGNSLVDTLRQDTVGILELVKLKPLRVIQRTEPECAWRPRPIPSTVMRRESWLVPCYDATGPVRLGEYGECRRPTSHGPVDLLSEKLPLSDRRIKARQSRASLRKVCVGSKESTLDDRD